MVKIPQLSGRKCKINDSGRMTFFDCIPCMIIAALFVLICVGVIWVLFYNGK